MRAMFSETPFTSGSQTGQEISKYLGKFDLQDKHEGQEESRRKTYYGNYLRH